MGIIKRDTNSLDYSSCESNALEPLLDISTSVEAVDCV